MSNLKNFEWAKIAMRDGRTVTRRAWGEPALCMHIEDGVYKLRVPGAPPDFHIVPSEADEAAHDWELSYSEGTDYAPKAA